jgi:hypothetical protein
VAGVAPALGFGAVRQHQALARAGDADVEQPPLFFQAAFFHRLFVRQVAVLAADDEDDAELQALGRVQAHQPHLVAGLAAIGVAEQRQLRRQFARAAAARGFEPAGQLVEVFLAAQEGGVVLALRRGWLPAARSVPPAGASVRPASAFRWRRAASARCA